MKNLHGSHFSPVNAPSSTAPAARAHGHANSWRPCKTLMIPVQISELLSMPQPGRNKCAPTRRDVPTAGLMHSPHGTIEMVVHKNGRVLVPRYNSVGILQSVRTSDGFTFARASDGKNWCILDRAGWVINTAPLKSVYFDKSGNLIYTAVDGCRTILTVDGKIAQGCHH